MSRFGCYYFNQIGLRLCASDASLITFAPARRRISGDINKLLLISKRFPPFELFISPAEIKNPSRMMLSKGCTQFTWPFGSSFYAGLFPRSGIDMVEGRSSGSLINLLFAPSHLIRTKQWYLQISSPITAAGPLPVYTGFPVKPYWAPWSMRIQYILVAVNIKLSSNSIVNKRS